MHYKVALVNRKIQQNFAKKVFNDFCCCSPRELRYVTKKFNSGFLRKLMFCKLLSETDFDAGHYFISKANILG